MNTPVHAAGSGRPPLWPSAAAGSRCISGPPQKTPEVT